MFDPTTYLHICLDRKEERDYFLPMVSLNNVVITEVSIHEILEQSYADKTLEAGVNLLLDTIAFRKIFLFSDKASFMAGLFNHILVLADPKEMEKLSHQELPKNLSFILYPCSESLLKTQLNHKFTIIARESGKSSELYFQQAEMLRSTLESIDDLLFSLNREGDFIEYYQPSGGTNLSLTSDVFVGKNIYDVGFPLDVARKYLQTIEQVMDEDRPEQIDYYLEAFGTRLWYNAKVSPRKNLFGIIEGVTVLVRDVTRQKKTEETLKKARDFYLTLLADFPTMIWKSNTARKGDYFNKTWLKFTGNDLDKELRSAWSDKIHPDDLAVFQASLAAAYRNKESFVVEHRLMHYSGEYKWLLNAGRPFYNLDGQFAGYIGSCYDISERKKAEEMMNLQKSAMDSALEGILIIKDDQKDYPVIYVNKEFCKLSPEPEESIIGRPFVSVLGIPETENISEVLAAALASGDGFKGEFSNGKGLDEPDYRCMLLYLAPIIENKSDSNHFVALVSDITESKQVEKTLRENNIKLRKTNEELDSFVYSTSHELRSPLMSVLGVLNLLEADVEQKEKEFYVGMIRESISRLDKIIHDIIDHSRNSRMEVLYEGVDFSDIVEDALKNHQYDQDYSRIRFIIDITDSVPFLSDRKRLGVIFNNLISNNIKFQNFNQEKPEVKISVKTSPVNAIITIQDNGVGISEKHLPRIFDMFYRGTEKSKGSGIGLYIVKEIIDKFKGSIQVQSEVNRGTTFIIDLPNYLNKNYKVLSLQESENI